MAYDSRLLGGRVVRLLTAEPTLTLNALAARFAVDRHTLTRAVTIVTGKSFRRLRQEYLVARTEFLMCEHPGASLKEIAALLGYQRAGSLYRMVRSRTGHTPTTFRQAIARGGTQEDR